MGFSWSVGYLAYNDQPTTICCTGVMYYTILKQADFDNSSNWITKFGYGFEKNYTPDPSNHPHIPPPLAGRQAP